MADSTDPIRKWLNPDDVSRVIARALELDAEREGRMNVQQVRDVAADVGISSEAIEDALQELDGRRTIRLASTRPSRGFVGHALEAQSAARQAMLRHALSHRSAAHRRDRGDGISAMVKAEENAASMEPLQRVRKWWSESHERVRLALIGGAVGAVMPFVIARLTSPSLGLGVLGAGLLLGMGSVLFAYRRVLRVGGSEMWPLYVWMWSGFWAGCALTLGRSWVELSFVAPLGCAASVGASALISLVRREFTPERGAIALTLFP